MYTAKHSLPWHQMEVSGQLHVPLRKRPSTNWGLGTALSWLDVVHSRKISAPTGNETPFSWTFNLQTSHYTDSDTLMNVLYGILLTLYKSQHTNWLFFLN